MGIIIADISENLCDQFTDQLKTSFLLYMEMGLPMHI